MSAPYLVPTAAAQAEFTEKRSRFLGQIFPVSSEEEAVACLKSVREQRWDASHNVYAYALHSGAARFSDDGEPGGTAGMPVLEVLRREGLSDALCVVTRYFGGILLGAGGLTRAYARAAKLAADAAGISEKRIWDVFEFSCPYSLFEQMKRETAACGGAVGETVFGAAVQTTVLLPREETARFQARLRDLSLGALVPAPARQALRAFPVRAPAAGAEEES